MDNFAIFTNYNKDSGIDAVKIGAEKPILEVELNEMQEIQRQKWVNFLSTVYGDGILQKGTITYSNGIFKIENTHLIINGKLIYVSNAQIAASSSDSLYIIVNEKETTYLDGIRKYGNQQEALLNNYIVDSRIGHETSRRIEIIYNLSKTAGTGYSYKIGNITSGGVLNLTAKQIYNNSDLEEKFNQFQSNLNNNTITVGTVQPMNGWWFKEI